MLRLSIGLVLWSGLHLIPALAPSWRSRLIRRAGEKTYKAVFGLAMFMAIGLMVTGWKSAGTAVAYWPPAWGPSAAMVLLWAASAAFFAPYFSNSVQRVFRHPQLTGVVLFAVAHLLSVGQWRGVLLFGGMGLWALLEILCLNRRDGDWSRPGAAPLRNDLALLMLGSFVFGVFVLFAHAWLFGVTPFSMGS